jgi:hypothetical protein
MTHYVKWKGVLIGLGRVILFVIQLTTRLLYFRWPYFVVAIVAGLLVILGLREVMDLPQLDWMIEIVSLHPFWSIVLALPTIFVFTVIYVLAFFTLGVLPPPMDGKRWRSISVLGR